MITKDLTINELFDKFPDKAELLADALLNRGLHCVGCCANAFESLEEGFMNHGFTPEELVDALNELNSIIADDSLNGLIISPSASVFIRELSVKRKAEGKTHNYLRMIVLHGCSSDSCSCGGSYGFKFVDSYDGHNDVLFVDSSGAKVVLDKNLLGIVRGNTLDYSKDGGFKIHSKPLEVLK